MHIILQLGFYWQLTHDEQRWPPVWISQVKAHAGGQVRVVGRERVKKQEGKGEKEKGDNSVRMDEKEEDGEENWETMKKSE